MERPSLEELKKYIGKEIEIEFIKNPKIKKLIAESFPSGKEIDPEFIKDIGFYGSLEGIVIDKNRCILKIKTHIYPSRPHYPIYTIILTRELSTTLSNIKSITKIVFRMPRF